jgi:hypothetical protein
VITMTDPSIAAQRAETTRLGPSQALRNRRRQTMGGGQIERLVSSPHPALRQAGDGWQELAMRQREFELLALGG